MTRKEQNETIAILESALEEASKFHSTDDDFVRARQFAAKLVAVLRMGGSLRDFAIGFSAEVAKQQRAQAPIHVSKRLQVGHVVRVRKTTGSHGEEYFFAEVRATGEKNAFLVQISETTNEEVGLYVPKHYVANAETLICRRDESHALTHGKSSDLLFYKSLSNSRKGWGKSFQVTRLVPKNAK